MRITDNNRKALIPVLTIISSITLILFACFMASEQVYAEEETGTINVVFYQYVKDGDSLEPVDKPVTYATGIQKLAPGDDSSFDIRYVNYQIKIDGEDRILSEMDDVTALFYPVNANAGEAKTVISDLPEGRYRIRTDMSAQVSGCEVKWAEVDDIDAATTDPCRLDIAAGEEKTVYIYQISDKEIFRYFQMSDGTWYYFQLRTPTQPLKGDLEEFINRLPDASLPITKKWVGEEKTESVKIRLRWKPDVNEEVDQLHRAITIKGVDEATIIDIITRYLQVKPSDRGILTDELMDAYYRAKEKPLDEVLKKALLGHLESYVLATLHNQDMGHIPQTVSVDDEGYCYIELTLDKAEDWEKTLKHVVIPNGFEVIELTPVKNNSFRWEAEYNGKTIKVRDRVWVPEADLTDDEKEQAYYDEEKGERGYERLVEYEKADPLDLVKTLTLINKHEPKAILSVKKTSKVTSASPGDIIPYVITITNKGDADAEEVITLDTMGDNLSYVSDDSNGEVDGQNVKWNVRVAAGGTKTIKINCRINESAAGKVVNNVVITSVKDAYIEETEGEDSFVLGISEEAEAEEAKEAAGAKTGDDAALEIMAVLLILAAMALTGMLIKRHKA